MNLGYTDNPQCQTISNGYSQLPLPLVAEGHTHRIRCSFRIKIDTSVWLVWHKF